MADFKENSLNWITNEKVVSGTFTQPRLISKIKRLAEKFPDEVKIEYVNKDGSILCELPLRAIKINLSPKREYSEEQLELMRERMRKMHEAGQEVDEEDFDEDLEDEE